MLALLLAATIISPQNPEFIVQPYYIYPADQPRHEEYVKAIDKCTKEVQAWYKKQAGVTFKMAPLKIIQSKQTYAQMRGNPRPDTNDKKLLNEMPNWWPALEQTLGGWPQKQVSWVFAQGGGGIAQANLVKDWQGMGIFGDWVLEPISGVREEAAVHSGFATWEVEGGTPIGTTAHELGHAFGLHHPDNYEGKSVMRAHWDYPSTGLLPHEILILKNSPFFVADAYDKEAPHLDFENADVMKWGETVQLTGKGFDWRDIVEFVAVDRTVRMPATLVDGKLEVIVPDKQGPGFIRIKQGNLRSNIVPVNFYEK
ncbi:MAG: hypothetical protein KF784_03235 [Fimbriimonadaceae bacterium]|nr:hypothetical protein [Fimbriimonadaceae bacterium]